MAIVKSGIPIRTVIVEGLDSSTFDTIDQGVARTTSDLFNVQGISNATTMSSILCRYNMISNNTSYGLTSGSYKRLNLTKRDYINEYNYPAVRRKIDSEILLEILYKTKSYKVLSEYIGGAALAWTWIGEPNKMYLWSGASKLWEHSKDKEEERPLCVYQKSKNNTYFSSLEESLYALGGTEANVCQIDYNTVYVITDGDFKNADKLPVSRTKVGQNEFYTPKTTTNTNFAYGNYTDDETWDGYDPSYHGRVNTQFSSVRKHTPSANTPVINIHKEPHFIEVPKRYGKIYFRYWRRHKV